MKFVMFPHGVCFFSEVIRHDDLHVFNQQGKMVYPIAAGTVHFRQLDLACKVIAFGGRSINLDMDARDAYPDWVARHEKSGISALRNEYPMFNAHVFFFPFETISEFDACGVGGRGEPKPTNLEDLCAYIEKNR